MRALGLAGGAAFLPSLAARESRAATGPPTRLLHLVTSHGTVYDAWKIRVGELDEFSDWQLELAGLAVDEFSPILAPLHGVREHLLILDGLAALGVGLAGTNEHEAGSVAALTGTVAIDVLDTIAVAAGPSIDQVVAKAIATPGQYPTLQYAVGGWPVCFDEFGQPIPYEADVFSAYERLFPGGQDPPALPSEAQAIRGAQPSVLDLVGEQYAALVPRLSGEDRQKLEQHRELIRGLELQLDGLAALACEAPVAPGELPEWGLAEYPLAAIQAYLSVIRVALACRLSPVITLRVETMFNATIDAPPGDIHTDWAHGADSDPIAAAVMAGYHRFHAAWIAALIGELAATPDEGGSLLDDTVVVWTNELGSGNHDFKRHPLVVAGGGGHFDLGRVVRWAASDLLAGVWAEHEIGPAHNRWLISLARAFGLELDVFGMALAPRVGGGSIACTGPLDRLTR
ncbi:DUF1552 domain-containing protein [Nannocystaceae bacterium ST9]